jgi:hypothetical protein
MIGQSAVESASFLESIRESTGLPDEYQKEFDELAKSAVSPRFPGAVLACPLSNESTVYYAVAASATEWRRLQPLLMAFAGPTLSSFKGWPEPFQVTLPVEEFLLSRGWYVVARFVPGQNERVTQMLRRSLVRMVETIESAPTTTHVAPQPTSRLIALFVDCLNGNNRVGAEHILEICRTELRVDALNLSFLRIQLLAHFNDWKSVREMPEFSSLCYTRKPPAVTGALLEALYQTHLSLLDTDDWIDQQRSCWRNDVRPHARPLLRLPIPKDSKASVLKLYAWDALDAEPRRPELEEAILKFSDSIGGLGNALVHAGRTGFSKNPIEIPATSTVLDDPLAIVQRALATADEDDTLESIGHALAQFGMLDEKRQKDLLRSEPFRSFLQNLHVETGGEPPPEGWMGWLGRLSDPNFVTAFTLLKRGVSEWPASSLEDPTEIAEFSNALGAVSDLPPASERIADAIPLLTAWVEDDPQFPRSAMSSVYETLLFHLVIGARRGSSVFDSAAILVRALLTTGIPAAQYGALLDDCLELVGNGAGTRNVYWLLDVLEETILNTAPDPNRRQSFWYASHARLYPLRAHLSAGQCLALGKLGASLGWKSKDIEELSSSSTSSKFDEMRIALSGTSVAIYSLTESAARQARQALETIAPDVRISISSDTCGTTALKSMALNSDIFIVATASAKHAATGFIQLMRPREKPTLFASGRGFSSIVRSIEEYLSA